MATDPNRDYFDFYLMGRDEAQDVDAEELELDYAELGKRVLSSVGPLRSGGIGGPNIREVAMVAAKDVAKNEVDDMTTWRQSSRRLRKEIEIAGGDAALAHRLYCAGYTDELAIAIESQILNVIAEGDDASDDDEEDEDEQDEDADSED